MSSVYMMCVQQGILLIELMYQCLHNLARMSTRQFTAYRILCWSLPQRCYNIAESLTTKFVISTPPDTSRDAHPASLGSVSKEMEVLC